MTLDTSTAPGFGLLGRTYTAEVTRLRKEYWKSRLGVTAATRCTCPTCGNTVSYTAEDFAEAENEGECDGLAIEPPVVFKNASKRSKCGRREYYVDHSYEIAC